MYKVLSIKYEIFKKYFVIALLIHTTCYLLLNTAPAGAQGFSLSLDPSIIEINALPPSNVSSALTIQNKGDTQATLQIQLKPFKAKGENGELEYLNSQDSFVTQSVQILDGGVPVEGIVLGPRQQKNLTLNINIPQDTNISGYYFSIIFVSDNNASPVSNASLNQLGIATNVLLSVGAKEIPNAVLQEFSAGLFYENGPVPFTVRIKNKGAHFIKPEGKILIKNMFGQNIGKLDLMTVNVLSNSIRAIPNTLWKENFLLGFYTATLDVALSHERPSFTKSIHFFAFPFQLLIVIVIALISAIIIINRVKAHMKK